MITDKLDNAADYYGIGELYRKGLEYLQKTDLSALDVGKYEIDGERLFVLIQEYDTKPTDECKWESHKVYSDIQYIISGRELMGYAPIDQLTNAIDHTPEKDVVNYKDGKSAGVYFTAETGDFFIFLPQDGHMPNIANERSVRNKKAVVKIMV